MYPNAQQQQMNGCSGTTGGGAAAMESSALLRSLQYDLHPDNELQYYLDQYTGNVHPQTQQQQRGGMGIAGGGGGGSGGGGSMLPLSLVQQYQMGQQQSPHWGSVDSERALSQQYTPYKSSNEVSAYHQSLFQEQELRGTGGRKQSFYQHLSEGLPMDTGSAFQPGIPQSFFYHDVMRTPSNVVEPSPVVPTPNSEEGYPAESSAPQVGLGVTPKKGGSKGSMTIKEKNRKAQKRFREKQKLKLVQLEVKEKELTEQLMASKSEIEQLRKDLELLSKRLSWREGQIGFLTGQPFSSQGHNMIENQSVDNLNESLDLISSWKNYVQQLQSCSQIVSQDNDNFRIEFRQEVDTITEQTVNQCLESAVSNPQSLLHLATQNLDKTTQKDNIQNHQEQQHQQQDQEQERDQDKDKEQDLMESETKVDQGQQKDRQQQIELFVSHQEDVSNASTDDMENDQVEGAGAKGQGESVLSDGSQGYDWATILCDLQLERSQIESIMQFRTQFLEGLNQTIMQRRQMEDGTQSAQEDILSNREISQVGIKLEEYLRKLQYNLNKEYQLQVEFVSQVFKKILTPGQLAKLALYSYPYFPDTLKFTNQILAQQADNGTMIQ